MDRKTQNGPIKTIKVIKVGFSGSLCLAYFPNGLFCFIFIDPLPLSCSLGNVDTSQSFYYLLTLFPAALMAPLCSAEVKVGHLHNPVSFTSITPLILSALLHFPEGLAHHLQLPAIMSCSQGWPPRGASSVMSVPNDSEA